MDTLVHGNVSSHMVKADHVFSWHISDFCCVASIAHNWVTHGYLHGSKLQIFQKMGWVTDAHQAWLG